LFGLCTGGAFHLFVQTVTAEYNTQYVKITILPKGRFLIVFYIEVVS
jgi:hypothetical protein